MKIKDGVILAGLHWRMRDALMAAERIYKEHDQELVITSGLDGVHSSGSWHYSGRAVDIRTRFWEWDDRLKVHDELTNELSKLGFRVIWHETHIHIDYPHAV